MDEIDCVVIGAGVVGLAAARALAVAGREVVVLEKEAAIGTETSARNSEVIHAGIYYPPGSLKARFCVAGRQALYAYCESHGVNHRRAGKLIVATTPNESGQLEQLLAHGHANGVTDLHLISRDEAIAMEPNLRCAAALHSPSTGIIDSHGLMLAYRGEAEDHGAMLAFESPLRSARVVAGGIELDVGGDNAMRVLARTVINCGGLHAPGVAARIEGLPPPHVPTAHYAKGNYFTLAGRSPFSRLIYPMPEAAGLGVHLTLDLGGQARFGPDVEWIDGIDYSVDPKRCEGFYAAIRTYWPGLPDNALQPAYAGIRPKINSATEAARDFVIEGPETHGVPGLVNLFGIESPGLTSSLAIADHIVTLLEK
jgi:L-2-hydroxyglutarate oxidase LhgO